MGFPQMLDSWFHPRRSAVRSLHGLTLLIALTAFPAWSQQLVPRLVADLRPNSEPASSELSWVTTLDGAALFTLDNSTLQRNELWRSDGTPEGTYRLGSGSYPPTYRVPVSQIDDVLYFGDWDNGFWRTDGTTVGTVRLAANLAPQNYVAAIPGGPLLFAAHRIGLSRGLWRTDGTAAGTWRLREGVYDAGVGAVRGSLAFFAATSTDHGSQLWTSDGTALGTQEVGPLASGEFPLGLYNFAPAGDGVVFAAYTHAHGFQEWRTDGTAEGTYAITDTLGPADGPIPTPWARAWSNDPDDPTALFVAKASDSNSSGMWRSDGTIDGTFLLTRPDQVVKGRPTYRPSLGLFTFEASDAATGSELWVTDGTAPGTRILHDSCPGPCSGLSSYSILERPGAPLVFVADDSAHGREPWVSDGTPEGTRLLGDLCPGACSSSDGVRGGFAPTTSGALFFAYPGDPGLAIFHTDWTTAGTQLAVPAPLPFELPSLPFPQAIDGALLFAVDDGVHGTELWASDGTLVGTRLVADISPGEQVGSSYPSELVTFGDAVYFLANDGDGEELWRSDGTASGTVKVSDHAAPPGWDLQQLVATPSTLFFLARSNDHQHAIWASDGTAANTRLLASFEATAHVPGYRAITIGERYYLLGPGLWTSEGTPGGTRQLVDSVEAGLEAANMGDELFFLRTDGGSSELWRTDGTLDGTRRLLGDNPPLRSPGHLLAFDGRLYLHASPLDEYQPGLWSTDGTASGTSAVPNSDGLRPWTVTAEALLAVPAATYRQLDLWSVGEPTAAPTLLARLADDANDVPPAVSFGNRIYFLVAQPGRVALWTSDGTPAGTHPSALVGAGHPLSQVATAAGRLFLIGYSSAWVSDGESPAVMVTTEPHIQTPLAALGDLVLFPASTRELGTELWSLDLAAPLPTLPAAPSDLTATVLDANTVELQWTDHAAEEQGFQVELRSPAGGWSTVHVAPANATVARIEPFDAGMPYTFRVRANNAAGASPPSNEASLTMPLSSYEPPLCAADSPGLCLHQEDIDVRVHWRNQRTGEHGVGHAAAFPGSSRSGTFWFFGEDNIELIVKVLDGRGVNGHYWTFWGGLSDVEYWVTVTETRSGNAATYHNPPGEICGGADVRSLPVVSEAVAPTPPAHLATHAPMAGPAVLGLGTHVANANNGTCAPASDALCLLDGRFRVTVDWRDQRTGNSGVGAALPGTDQSGYFWFFDAGNVELVVKALDGRPINGKHWIFYGALSDVEYTIRVTDTTTGAVRTYRNPPGEICGAADVEAF